MTGRSFVDTNILLYSVNLTPVDNRKSEIAQRILDRRDLALSIQVLQEFYVQATRSSRKDALEHQEAVDLLTAWARFPVQEMSMEILNAALEIHVSHRFSYWDSAVIAAAQALGCDTLYSEDMSHGQRLGGLTIIDPFRQAGQAS